MGMRRGKWQESPKTGKIEVNVGTRSRSRKLVSKIVWVGMCFLVAPLQVVPPRITQSQLKDAVNLLNDLQGDVCATLEVMMLEAERTSINKSE